MFLWTLTFAVASVALTFGLGLFLAITINGLRGTRIYRSLLILPYAFPVFLSGLIWSGLLNETFGYVNQVLLGGAEVPWLQDPFLAKISVILVSVWFGFPYFFLVCLGAAIGSYRVGGGRARRRRQAVSSFLPNHLAVGIGRDLTAARRGFCF